MSMNAAQQEEEQMGGISVMNRVETSSPTPRSVSTEEHTGPTAPTSITDGSVYVEVAATPTPTPIGHNRTMRQGREVRHFKDRNPITPTIHQDAPTRLLPPNKQNIGTGPYYRTRPPPIASPLKKMEDVVVNVLSSPREIFNREEITKLEEDTCNNRKEIDDLKKVLLETTLILNNIKEEKSKDDSLPNKYSVQNENLTKTHLILQENTLLLQQMKNRVEQLEKELKEKMEHINEEDPVAHTFHSDFKDHENINKEEIIEIVKSYTEPLYKNVEDTTIKIKKIVDDAILNTNMTQKYALEDMNIRIDRIPEKIISFKDELTESLKDSVKESVRDELTESLKESVKESVKDELTESLKESVKESVRDELTESLKESVKESVKDELTESLKESVKGSVRDEITESLTESLKESVKESVKDELTESLKESVKESVRDELTESLKESVKESVRDELTESLKESVKGSVRDEITESLTESLKESVKGSVIDNTLKNSVDDLQTKLSYLKEEFITRNIGRNEQLEKGINILREEIKAELQTNKQSTRNETAEREREYLKEQRKIFDKITELEEKINKRETLKREQSIKSLSLQQNRNETRNEIIESGVASCIPQISIGEETYQNITPTPRFMTDIDTKKRLEEIESRLELLQTKPPTSARSITPIQRRSQPKERELDGYRLVDVPLFSAELRETMVIKGDSISVPLINNEFWNILCDTKGGFSGSEGQYECPTTGGYDIRIICKTLSTSVTLKITLLHIDTTGKVIKAYAMDQSNMINEHGMALRVPHSEKGDKFKLMAESRFNIALKGEELIESGEDKYSVVSNIVQIIYSPPVAFCET
jgi:hypothetical protein